MNVEIPFENGARTLIQLDAAGFLLAPGEKISDFQERLEKLSASLAEVKKALAENGEYKLMGELSLRVERKIDSGILDEAAAITEKYYDFKISWVPGFFLSKSLGIFWGGCAISFPENYFSVFLIRANFAKQKRWLFYKRDELLAHELCHVARIPLKDRRFEEFFAYRLSPSRLRRYMGDWFQTGYDAVFFVLPIFLLLSAQICRIVFSLEKIPVWPFWILAGLYPSFLFIRSCLTRRIFFRAEKNLSLLGVEKPSAVLFRCTKEEIKFISDFKDEPQGLKQWLEEQAYSEPRWEIIKTRFLGELSQLQNSKL